MIIRKLHPFPVCIHARHVIRLVLHTHKQREKETIHAFNLYDRKL